jgi:hypothetical protein
MERFHLQFQGYGLLCKHVFVNHDDDGHGSENIQEGFIFNLGKIVLQSPAQEHGKDPVNLALAKQTKVFVPCKVGKPASNDIAVQVMGALRAVVAAENDVRRPTTLRYTSSRRWSISVRRCRSVVSATSRLARTGEVVVASGMHSPSRGGGISQCARRQPRFCLINTTDFRVAQGLGGIC